MSLLILKCISAEDAVSWIMSYSSGFRSRARVTDDALSHSCLAATRPKKWLLFESAVLEIQNRHGQTLEDQTVILKTRLYKTAGQSRDGTCASHVYVTGRV